jgi:hypothetical protein
MMNAQRPGRRTRLYARCRAALFVLMVSAGCSGSTDGPTAKVSGKVTLAGAPVPAGTVLFMTDDGQAATAELGADGAYVVQCRPGAFKVSVSPPPPPDPLAGPAASTASSSAQPIPPRYRDLGRSGLTIEVQEGDNQFDISLTR